MKFKIIILLVLITMIGSNSCRQPEMSPEFRIIFLHHSTGGVIWRGTSNSNSFVTKVARKISTRLLRILESNAQLPLLFKEYNKQNHTNYNIKEISFPKASPYGWNNNPYDYYNIWVKNGGKEFYMEEPTLEILTNEYQVIIFKHCYPVSNITADVDSANINSNLKTIANYKLQYSALRDKLHEFPDTKFILFTGAAQVKNKVSEDEAERAKEFFRWVREEWDLPKDNIYLWDLFSLQTEGGLYLRNEYARSINDSHPNVEFASKAVKLLFNRIIDVVENNGERTMLTGEVK